MDRNTLAKYLGRAVALVALLQLSVYHELAAADPSVDQVVVVKGERKMYLMADGEAIREYDISLGDSPQGHKQRQGDEKTPEGRYTLDWHNANSSYFRSIHISYPNAQDRRLAQEAGYSPGGDIFIHGLPNGMGALGSRFEGRDWTDGCIAVNNNEQMLEIWELVENGTPIEIRP